MITNHKHENKLGVFPNVFKGIGAGYWKKNQRYFSVCFSEACPVYLEKLLFRICFYSILHYKEDIV